MSEVKLFRKHANGMGYWRIWSVGAVIYIAHATSLDGSEVQHKETVTTNQSGRTLAEQVALRIRSRISRMMDRGYKETMELAAASSGNQLGLDRPMLAKKYREAKNVNKTGSVIQKKLDGHRCLVTLDGGKPFAYSRVGKPIPAIRHILRALEGRLPEGVTLDGELYCHGVKLQTIGSWIKREQPRTADLYYVVYDIMSPDSYTDRHAELSEIIAGVDTGVPGKIMALPYRPYEDEGTTFSYFREVRAQGFEGLMQRLDGYGYQAGVRSASLLKIKEFEDEEFVVIGVKPSKTGWAVCTCRTAAGREFDCSAPGSHAEKRAVLERSDEYIGRKLTIEFAHWTDDGIPFQPTAVRWFDSI